MRSGVNIENALHVAVAHPHQSMVVDRFGGPFGGYGGPTGDPVAIREAYSMLASRPGPGWAALLAALLVASAMPSAVAAASEVTAAPVLESPASGETVNGYATFAWGAVASATNYRVQVAAAPMFTSLLFDLTTSDRFAIPAVPLPSGALNWRVAGVDGNGAAGPWADGAFTATWVPGAPALLTPADNSFHTVGGSSLSFTWSWVDGATSYEFAWAGVPSFVGGFARVVPTNAFTFDTQTEPQPRAWEYWRVRAIRSDGAAGAWSATRFFTLETLLAPQIIGPDDGSQSANPILRWGPVPGATHYEFLSEDAGMNTPVMGTSVQLFGDLRPGTYGWQVRAVNDVRHWQGEWSPRRTVVIPNSMTEPVLSWPSDGAVLGDIDRLSWEPMKGAQGYYLQVVKDGQAFLPTGGIWLTKPSMPIGLLANDRGLLGVPGTYRWRVEARGANYDFVAYSAQRTFEYVPPLGPQTVVPAAGSTVGELIFRWAPMSPATSYEVFVRRVSDGAILFRKQTSATSWNAGIWPSGGPVQFEWWVVGQWAESRHVSFTYVPSTDPGTSTTSLVAPADGASVQDFPTMRWTLVSGASQYRVWMCRVVGVDCSYRLFSDSAPISTEYTDGIDSPIAGTYRWFIEARSPQATTLSISTVRSFNILPLAAPDLIGPADCPSGGSCVSPDEPVLSWSAVPGGRDYQVTITRDPTFAAPADFVIGGAVLAIEVPQLEEAPGTRWFWYVQACNGGCTPVAEAQAKARSFQKRSPAPELLFPADGATVTDYDVVFRWQDFLVTEQAAGGSQSAERYDIQFSTSLTFNAWEDGSVPGTSFVPTLELPLGTVYWRVRAKVRGILKPLAWSAARSFTRVAASPSLALPDGAIVAADTPILKWAPAPPGQTYDVEIAPMQGTPLVDTVRPPAVTSAVTTAGTALPPGTYEWRTRRIDVVGGRTAARPWSGYSTFAIAQADQASLLGGADPIYQDRRVLLRWQAVDRATSYRVDINPASDFSRSGQSVVTQALAWAPPAALGAGRHYWRVRTLNAAGHVLSTSATGTFRYDAGGSPPPPPPAALAADDFSRTVTDGWSNAPTGGPWSLTGAAANFDVASGAGTMDLRTAGVSRAALLGAISARDVEVSLRLATNKVPIGGNAFLYAVVRRVSATREYRIKVRLGSNSGVYLQATSVVDGIETGLGTEVRVAGLSNVANAWIRLRARITGSSPTTIQIRAWADGGTEPTTWTYAQANSTASLQAAGSVGLRAYLSGSLTNAPVLLRVDDLLVTDAGGGSPPPPPPPPPSTLASDSFGRALADSWGSANTGGSWTLSGSASNFDVAAGAGTIALPSAGASRGALLGSASGRDVDMSLRFATDTLAVANSEYVYAVVRRVSPTREYRMKVRLAPNAGVFVQATSVVDGVETGLGAEVRVTGLTYAPNGWIRLRARITGASPTTLQIRAWADGAAEPTAWAYTQTDSTPSLQVAGSVGLRAYLSAKLTNAPVVLRFDDLLVANAGG
jgi:hypothetical protein